MIDGAALRDVARLGSAATGVDAGAGAGDGVVVLLSFENILACLQEVHGIVGLAVDTHFIVHMRTGDAAGTAEFPDLLSIADLLADLNRNRLQMRVSGAYA